MGYSAGLIHKLQLAALSSPAVAQRYQSGKAAEASRLSASSVFQLPKQAQATCKKQASRCQKQKQAQAICNKSKLAEGQMLLLTG